MTDTLTTITPDIDRDRWGRPMILPPGGGKKVAYTRATTLAGAIEDLNGLITWKISRAVLGIVDRPDLLLSAAAHREDKKKLYKLCDDALEAGGTSSAATIGTALHSFTEQIDRGLPAGAIPDAYRADIAAYEKTTANLERLHVEQLLVVDDLKVAGTPDLIVRYQGENYIADKKTGSIDYPHKMAAQLALYAHGMFYDVRTGEREPLPAVNGQRGLIIHLPAGTGQCSMHWIDLAAGWEAVQLAVQVREWRKHKGLLAPLEQDQFTAATDVLRDAGLIGDPVIAEIEAASTRRQIEAIWARNETRWSDTYTAAATSRITQLAQTA